MQERERERKAEIDRERIIETDLVDRICIYASVYVLYKLNILDKKYL